MAKKVDTLVDNDALLLEETEGSVVVFDLRDFSRLAQTMSPLELGLGLSGYYMHTEKVILGNGGRVVRFVGDMVMGAWLAKQVGDHQKSALKAVADAEAGRSAWRERAEQVNLPVLDYSIAAASGPMLAGHIGTPRMRQFDVLGESPMQAVKLATVATSRNMGHLVTFSAPGILTVEVEGVELGGRQLRLFRLATT
jgi:adenylate cyclase